MTGSTAAGAPVVELVAGSSPDAALAVARRLAAGFARRAHEVDVDGAFPEANVAELRGSGLLGLLVPCEHGGLGLDLAAMVEVAQVLGAACASTAMLWAMHCQQVATLVNHAGPELSGEVLPQIATGRVLLASVTTEPGKGGHLLTAIASLQRAPAAEDHDLLLERTAPVVSAGRHADAFLITMRTSPESPSNDTTLAYVPRTQADVTLLSEWDVAGMRGTESVGLRITAAVPERHLVHGRGGFRHVAVSTMIPVGHLAWSAVWLGAARGALVHVLSLLRDPKTRSSGQLQSDLALHDLARIRLQIDGLSAFLASCLAAYEALRAAGTDGAARFDDTSFQLQINGLKVAVSEGAFDAVNAMVTLTGLRFGYRRSPDSPLERVFRDLRSAALMYANDRLLLANGRLALLDRQVRLLGDRSSQGPADGSDPSTP